MVHHIRPPPVYGVELQEPLLPPAAAPSSDNMLTDLPVDARISIADYLPVPALFSLYQVGRALQRVFHAELATLPRLQQSLSPERMAILGIFDPFFRGEEVERTAEFGRRLLAVRKQVVEDVKTAQLMAEYRKLVLPSPRSFEIAEITRVWGYSEVLELMRFLFQSQISPRKTLIDRPQTHWADRWMWRFSSTRRGFYAFGQVAASYTLPASAGMGVFSLFGCCVPIPPFLPWIGYGTGCLLSCGVMQGYVGLGFKHLRTQARLQGLQQLWLDELLHVVEAQPSYRQMRAWLLQEENYVMWESYPEMRALKFWRTKKELPSKHNPFYEDGYSELKYLSMLHPLRKVIQQICRSSGAPEPPSRPYVASQELVEACRGNEPERVKEILIQEQADVNHLSCLALVSELIFRKRKMVELFVLAGLDLLAFDTLALHEFFYLVAVAGLFINDSDLIAAICAKRLPHTRYDFAWIIFLCGTFDTNEMHAALRMFCVRLDCDFDDFLEVFQESSGEVYGELSPERRAEIAHSCRNFDLRLAGAALPELRMPIFYKCLSRIFERNLCRVQPQEPQGLPEGPPYLALFARFWVWLNESLPRVWDADLAAQERASQPADEEPSV